VLISHYKRERPARLFIPRRSPASNEVITENNPHIQSGRVNQCLRDIPLLLPFVRQYIAAAESQAQALRWRNTSHLLIHLFRRLSWAPHINTMPQRWLFSRADLSTLYGHAWQALSTSLSRHSRLLEFIVEQDRSRLAECVNATVARPMGFVARTQVADVSPREATPDGTAGQRNALS
jgi:hypothetical protein